MPFALGILSDPGPWLASDTVEPSRTTDTGGPGSHILHQLLAVPAAGVILTCRVFVNNGAPPVINYMAVTADLSAFAGNSVRLRIAEVDNQFFMNFGVDDCSTADVPVELMGFTIE